MLKEQLARSGYQDAYRTESAFEAEVWRRVVNVAKQMGLIVSTACLTSHLGNPDRSAAAWKEFCRGEHGPDVNVLGSNNRLDIILRHSEYGSFGIEVKCLGRKSHTSKLTQGLGRALLGLAYRDRTLLVIHCGKVDADERERL